MTGFTLQSGHICREESALMNYCVLNRVPYKICRKPEESPDGYIPCGTVEWCEKFLPKEKATPDYYPEFLKDHLFRNVWKTNTWPWGQKVFIKPADFHKRFNGKITTGTFKGKKRGPYWCSGIVSFTNEWRYYVADGKILVGEWYSGDEINEPDAPVLNITIPEGYCGALDFGTLTTGELALVEAQPPYACGWYGKKHALFAEWLIKGWAYLTK
jgi:hypothetical protein